MREIGVRELKAALSETLRSAGAGERIRVTVHGRPIADIVPTGAADEVDPLEALVREGILVPATRPLPTATPRPLLGTESATAIILAERDAER